MKKQICIILCLMLVALSTGCTNNLPASQVVATTLPVYTFTTALCQGTGISVTQLVTENISCLHDYNLKVSQMRSIERAEVLVVSGAGLESFLNDTGTGSAVRIDASAGIALICADHHSDEQYHDHHHENDPHIWMSPSTAKIMAENICHGLTEAYPQNKDQFKSNLLLLHQQFDALQLYADQQLSHLSSRNIITFHDGFAYMAQAFNLNILRTIEEESGSEASAKQLIDLIKLTQDYNISALFAEKSGSSSAASVIAAETGAEIYMLDMAMSGSNYFDAMYQNINTLKEALE